MMWSLLSVDISFVSLLWCVVLYRKIRCLKAGRCDSLQKEFATLLTIIHGRQHFKTLVVVLLKGVCCCQLVQHFIHDCSMIVFFSLVALPTVMIYCNGKVITLVLWPYSRSTRLVCMCKQILALYPRVSCLWYSCHNLHNSCMFGSGP